MAFEQEGGAEAAFDAAINSLRQSQDAEQNGKLTSFFNASQDIPIDQAQRVLSLMGKTGIDVDILASNLDEAEKLAPDTNWDDFRRTSPIMAKWYAQSPYHMKIGEEDRKTGAAQNLERLYYRKDNAQRPLTKDEIKAQSERYGKRHAAFKLAQKEAIEKRGVVDEYGRSMYMGPDASTLPEMEKALAQRYSDELEVENKFITETDKVGFLESWTKRGRENPAFLLPFIGSAVDLGKNIELYEAATAKNPTEDQTDLLVRYGRLAEAAERRGADVFGKTAEIMSGIPAVAGEFAATGGAYRGGKAAVEKLLRTSMKRALTRGLGTVAGAATQTAADPLSVANDAIRRVTPGIKVTADQRGQLGAALDPKAADDFIPAITKALGTNFVEKFSERTGASLEDGVGWLKSKFFGEALKAAPTEGVAGFLSRVGKATGWNGVIGEMYEERVGEVLKAPIDGYHPPSFEQLVAEFMAFSVPGTPGQVAERIRALKNKGDVDARIESFKELAEAIKQIDAVNTAPEIGQKIVETLSAEAGEVTGKKFGYIDPHEFAEYAESKGVKPEDAAVALMGTAQVYNQAIVGNNDMQVPRSRIDSILLTGESAAYFQDKIRDNPGEMTERESKAELDRIEAVEKAQSEQAAAAKEAKQQEAENAEAIKQVKESVQRVADQITQGLEAAGRKSEARAVSKVVADTFRILGKKQKADPFKLFQKRPLTINAPLKAGEQRLDQPAYHGTGNEKPYDRFDINKVGGDGGEGAQVYGWGIYVAGNKKTGQFYRESLSDHRLAPEIAKKYLDLVGGDKKKAIERLRKDAEAAGQHGKQYDDAAKFLETGKHNPGRLYTVDIPENADFLDLDKTIGAQPDGIKALLKAAGIDSTSTLTEENFPATYKVPGGYFITKESDPDFGDKFFMNNASGVKYRLNWTEVKRFIGEDGSGTRVYGDLLNALGSDKAASLALLKAGVRGLRYLDAGSRGSEGGTHNYVLFDDRDIKIKSYEQPGRGFIQVGNARLNIQLPEGADRSTFLHEFGHFYVEVLADMAAEAGATDEIKEHFSELLEWWGVKDVETWRGMSFEEKRKYHERFAKAWEKYLMEGQAPSKGLRKVFHQITKWLTSIYRDSPTYFDDIAITPDIRRFMDRMLATEEEIEEAQADYGRPLYETLVKAGMHPDKAAALAKATEENAEAVSAKLRAKAMKDIEREEAASWKSEKESLKPEIAKQVDGQRIYQILNIFKTGKLPKSDAPELISFPDGFRFKLDKAAVKELFGSPEGEVPDTIPSYVYAASGDLVHPDYAADQFGYPDGRALLEAIANAEPREELIDRLAEEEMLKRHGPPMTREDIAAEAERALHGANRDKVLQLELQELAEKNLGAVKEGMRGIMAKARVPNAAEVKRRAEKDIAAHPVSWINPQIYKHAEIKAEKAAEAAALKGDWKTAYDQKVISYINHARYVAASEAREAVRDALNKARDLKKSDKKFSKTSDVDLINAARAIYAAHGIGKFDKQASEYLKKLEAYDSDVYRAVMGVVSAATQNAADYKEIKFSQFQAMQEAVESLLTLARRTRQMEVEGKKVDLEDIKAEILAAFDKLSRDYSTVGGTKKAGLWDKIKRTWLSVKAIGRRVESWADAMGPLFTKYIWNPVKGGILQYRQERIRVINAYLGIVKQNAKIFGQNPIDAPELNYKFENMAELIGALLHTGNESNLMKLLVGGRPGNKWGDTDEMGNLDVSKWEAFRQRMIREGVITKEVYDFLQAVWDLNESIKPAAQRAHKELYGHYFKEIDADFVVTPWGTYRGGYVPAKTDPFLVQDGAIREAKDDAFAFNDLYSHPTTYQGFTMMRSRGYAKPLNLDIGQVVRHFDEVLRFAYIKPRVNDVLRLLTDDEFAAKLSAHDPEAYQKMLKPWLQRSVQQKSETAGFDPGLDTFFRAVRRNAGMQLMVGNVTNALQNLPGVSVAGVKVEGHHLRNALFDYMQNPAKVTAEILEESAHMEQTIGKQAADIQREISDIILQPNGFDKFRAWTDKHGQVLQHLTQNPISLITYIGAKNQALENGMSEEEAIREAEATVRLTQGAFGPEDIARYEASTPFVKLFSQFTGYWNMKANLMGTEFAKVAREMGLKNGAGRAFNIYVMGHMIPAVLAAMILKTMGNGWDDDDDDGYLDEVMAMFFGSQLREALALVPILGQASNAAMTAFGGENYGDRILSAPAISLIEAGVRVPGELYKSIADGELKKRGVKDSLSIIGLFSGVPVGALGRPVGYLMDVESGRAEPSGPIDFARGVITGKAGRSR